MGVVCSCEDAKHVAVGAAHEVDVSVDAAKAAVADAAEHIADAAGDHSAPGLVETVVAAVDNVQEKIASMGEAAVDRVAEAEAQVVGAVKHGGEAVCATIEAAVAAVTGVVVIEFSAEKGAVKRVEFTTNMSGLALGLSGSGCCRPAGQPQVMVKKVAKGSQGQRLGVKAGWHLKTIGGAEVTGLEQAQRLLAERLGALPSA